MDTELAKGENYFENPEYPITVRRVLSSSADAPSHAHDLTEVKHVHDFHELAIVVSGTAMHWLKGEEFPVTAGDVFLLQGREDHYFFRRERLEMINVMYDPRLIGLPDNRLYKMPGYCALFLLEPIFRKQHRFSSRLVLEPINLSRAEEIANEMEREVSEKREGHEAVLLSKLIELIVFLSRAYEDSHSVNSAALLRVGNAISSMERDPSREWRLEDFVSMSRLSRSQFIRTFTKATGISPMEYLIQLRVQRASRLLSTTQLAVSEIAFEVGFNDSNYFARLFRQRKGAAPSAYRQVRLRAGR